MTRLPHPELFDGVPTYDDETNHRIESRQFEYLQLP